MPSLNHVLQRCRSERRIVLPESGNIPSLKKVAQSDLLKWPFSRFKFCLYYYYNLTWLNKTKLETLASERGRERKEQTEKQATTTRNDDGAKKLGKKNMCNSTTVLFFRRDLQLRGQDSIFEGIEFFVCFVVLVAETTEN